MATRKSTKRRAKQSHEAFAAELFANFDKQPAQITAQERDQIEAEFSSNASAVPRRMGLQALTLSGEDLIKAASGDRAGAAALAEGAERIRLYADRLKAFAEMMESASTRIALALCDRADMQSLMAEAKLSVQEVAHAH